MDLFKLLGTIAIDNSEANKAIENTSTRTESFAGKMESLFAKVGTSFSKMFDGGKSKEAAKSFDEVSSATEKQREKLDKLKAEYKNLYMQQGKNSSETKKVAEEIEKLSTEIQKNEEDLEEASKAADKYDKSLKDLDVTAEKTGSKLGKVFGAIGKGAAVVGKGILVGLGAAATGMGVLTAKALGLSGELEQNMGGAEAVFGDLGETIGEMSTTIITGYDEATGKAITATKDLETVSKDAYKNMGLSQSDYLATANKMGALFKGAGFETQEALNLSSQAMQRAADVASIMGIDTEAAMEAVAGAAKGNFTMMDNLGVAMNDTAIAAYAQSKGINKSTQEMTQQEKIGLAMEMFLEKTSYAAGNYAKENETLAGSLSTAKSALTNFLAGSGDVESLVSSFSNLANVVVKNLTEIAPRLTTGLSDLVQQIVPLIPPLLNSLLPALVDGAVTLVNGLVQAMPGIVSAIMSALPALIQGVVQLVTSLALALPQIIQPIVDALPQIIQTLVQALPTLIPALIDGLVQMIVMLCQVIPQIIQPIIDNLPTIIISIVNALVQNLPALIQGIIQLVMGIIAALPQIFQSLFIELPVALWNGIIDGLTQTFSGLGAWFGETFSGAKEWAVNAWSDAKEKWEGVKQNVQGAFENVGNWFSEKFGEAKKNAEQAWSNAKQSWETIKGKVVEGFSKLKSDLGKKFEEAKKEAEKKWANAKKAWEGIKGKVVEGFSNLKKNIGDKFEEAKKWAESKWDNSQSTWSNISNLCAEGFSGLGAKIGQKFEEAKQWAKKAWDDAGEVGKNLVEGIWKGISGSFEWIKKKLKQWTGDITKFIKNLFGIKSPSRVMRDEVGKMIAEGMAVGMEGQKKRLESAAEKMGKVVLDTAQDVLDKYKTYNDLSLIEEMKYWDEIRQQCEEGTDARFKADQKYLDAKEQLLETKKDINDEFIDAEEELQSSLDEISQKIIDQQGSILDSFSLFEKFTEGNAKPIAKGELLGNLGSQVKALEMWQDELVKLESRIGGTDLFNEIKGMGVSALSQVMEINTMTDRSLQEYVDLHNKRTEIAGDLATYELKDETNAATQEAFRTFAKKCTEISGTVTEVFTGMKDVATTAFEDVGSAVEKSANMIGMLLDKMKTTFENWKPELKTPHFSLKGDFDLENGRMPAVSVEWYKKAMNNAVVLDEPTIFGYNQTTGNLMGAGEAGSEVVAGSNTLMSMIQNAVAEQNNTLAYYLQKIIEMLAAYFPQLKEAFNVSFAVDGYELATAMAVPMNQALGKLSSRKDRGR